MTEQSLDRVESSMPPQVSELREKGNASFREQNYKIAAQEYSRALGLCAKHATTAHLMASTDLAVPSALSITNLTGKAVKWMQSLRSLSTLRSSSLPSLAEGLAQDAPSPAESKQQQQQQEELPKQSRLSQRRRSDGSALRSRSRSSSTRSQPSSPAAESEDGEAAHPDDMKLSHELAQLFSNRSASYLKLNQNEDALRDAKESVRLDPQWGKAFFRRAEAYFALQQHDSALTDYKKARALLMNDKRVVERIQQLRALKIDAERGLMIHQLLPGRDICTKTTISPISKLISQFATQMQNLIYIIADVESRKCLLMDPCWDVDGIMRVVAAHKYQVVGVVIGHNHFDHVGGPPPSPWDKYKVKVPGLHTLVKMFSTTTDTPAASNGSSSSSVSTSTSTSSSGGGLEPLDQCGSKEPFRIYVHQHDWPEIVANNARFDMLPTHSLSADAQQHAVSGGVCVVFTEDGGQLTLGQRTQVSFIHTPGHTPGSQCLLVNGKRLFTSDTLFCCGCGRYDLPGGDRYLLRESLRKLRSMLGTPRRRPSITTDEHLLPLSLAVTVDDSKKEEEPESVIIYPGHAYGGFMATIDTERDSGTLTDAYLAKM